MTLTVTVTLTITETMKHAMNLTITLAMTRSFYIGTKRFQKKIVIIATEKI
mgnify:FL=1